MRLQINPRNSGQANTAHTQKKESKCDTEEASKRVAHLALLFAALHQLGCDDFGDVLVTAANEYLFGGLWVIVGNCVHPSSVQTKIEAFQHWWP